MTIHFFLKKKDKAFKLQSHSFLSLATPLDLQNVPGEKLYNIMATSHTHRAARTLQQAASITPLRRLPFCIFSFESSWNGQLIQLKVGLSLC